MTDPLLSRLTSLTGPDREVDAEIALAVHPWLKECPRDDRGGDPEWMTKDGRTYAPHYTASIDAALTTASPGWVLHMLHGGTQWADGTQPWTATVCVNGDWQKSVDGEHLNSAAIAIVIAFMKAKEPTP